MINKIFKIIASGILSFFAFGSHAQIPVTDILLNATQMQSSANTIASWAQQYSQMVSQYTQQLAQVKAMTSRTGMGQIASTMTRQTLPSDFSTSFNSIQQNGVLGASSGGQAIYNTSLGTFNCAAQFPNNKSSMLSCEAQAMAAPQNLSMMNIAIKNAQTRATQMQLLVDQVDAAPDGKAAADLSNRISSELAFMSNEKMMMDMALAAQKEQAVIAAQANKNAYLKKLSNANYNIFSN